MGFPRFYWGITAWRRYGFIPASEAVLISAMSLWSARRWKRDAWIAENVGRHVEWALDSGGFVALRNAGDYPFGPDEYLRAIERWRPSWAASLDYPCEPELLAERGWTVEENIDRTVELARYLCARSDKIVPVLQGFTIDEYERCWRRLPRTGRIAIGSVCRRSSLGEIQDLAAGLRAFVDVPWRHGFGVKILGLRRPEVVALFTSVDSNAWEMRAFMGSLDQKGKASHQERLSAGFDRYRARVDALRAEPIQGVLGC